MNQFHRMFIRNLLNDLLNQPELEDYHNDIRVGLSYLDYDENDRQKQIQNEAEIINILKGPWNYDPN